MTSEQIIELEPNTIGHGSRIGLFWPEKAKALGALMKRDGQNDPIKVRVGGQGDHSPYVLVAGLHRLIGAHHHGLKIKAIVVEGDDLALRLIEASENMHRRDFGPIEKALFIRALADVYEAQFIAANPEQSQQQVAIRARWDIEKGLVQNGPAKLAELEAGNTAETISAVYGWQENAADALGMTSRSLRDYLLIHRQIIAPLPDHYEDFARHDLGQKRAAVMEVAAIASVDDRRAVIDCLLEYPPGLTVAEAKRIVGVADARVGAPPPVGQSKFMTNAAANLDRLSVSSWRDWAPVLAEKVKPSALLTVRAALDERIEALRAAGKLTEDDA